MPPTLDLRMVRVFREAAKMSQAELADLADISQAKISSIENGRANPETKTLRALCAALDLELVFVPGRISGNVRRMVDQHLNRSSPWPSPVMSVREELFIPDPEEGSGD